MGVIPAQTQLLTSLSINTGTPSGGHVEVTLTTSNDTVIRGVLIFAEVIHNKFSPTCCKNAQVTSYKMIHKKRHHFLAQFFIPFHMVCSVLLRVLASKTIE